MPGLPAWKRVRTTSVDAEACLATVWDARGELTRIRQRGGYTRQFYGDLCGSGLVVPAAPGPWRGLLLRILEVPS